MGLQMLKKFQRKREIKRLEGIKDQFMQDYLVICEKYKAHLIPLVVPAGNATFRVIQQLDLYEPLTPETKAKLMAQMAKKKEELENETLPPPQNDQSQPTE